MARCISCGAELPDYYTQCPNCGTPLQQGAAPQPTPMYGGQPQNPYAQPYAQPMAQPAYPPQREVTSAGAWFGWMLLIAFLPIIGPIIMLCCTKDESAKNYAKMILILYLIVVVFYIILIVAGVGIFSSILDSMLIMLH